MIHQFLIFTLLLLRCPSDSLSFVMMISSSSYRHGSSSYSYPSSSIAFSSLLQKKNRSDASNITSSSRRRKNCNKRSTTTFRTSTITTTKNTPASFTAINSNNNNNNNDIQTIPKLSLLHQMQEKINSFYATNHHNLQSTRTRTTTSTQHAIKQSSSSSSIYNSVLSMIATRMQQSWWCLPMMILILHPIITFIKNGSLCAQMPHWWSMCHLHYLHTSYIGHWICFGFLTSNVFYFLSAFYLLNGIPFTSSSSSSLSSLLLFSSQSKDESRIKKQDNANNKTNPYKKKSTNNNLRYPLLGWLVLSSGSISLLYHSFQAWGAINIAESLCYIDHGLALSSGCCFLDKCGMPSSKTLLIGIISLCMLIFGGDTIGSFEYTYPIIHSFWHLGSAGATISWAFDGSKRRKKFIMDTLQERRRSKLMKDYS